MRNNNSNSSGIGFAGLLGISFIILKLSKAIDWSWWWVTCPFWIPPAVLLIIGAVMYCYGAVTLNSRLRRSGMTDDQIRELKRKIKEPTKSKWQQRIEQMQKLKQK